MQPLQPKSRENTRDRHFAPFYINILSFAKKPVNILTGSNVCYTRVTPKPERFDVR